MFNGKYVIWSFEHGAYWRSASAGYCSIIFGAGLYDRDEAEKIATDANRFADRKNEEARDAETEFHRFMSAASENTIGSVLREHFPKQATPE